jgi:hypothetical protein
VTESPRSGSLGESAQDLDQGRLDPVEPGVDEVEAGVESVEPLGVVPQGCLGVAEDLLDRLGHALQTGHPAREVGIGGHAEDPG